MKTGHFISPDTLKWGWPGGPPRSYGGLMHLHTQQEDNWRWLSFRFDWVEALFAAQGCIWTSHRQLWCCVPLNIKSRFDHLFECLFTRAVVLLCCWISFLREQQLLVSILVRNMNVSQSTGLYMQQQWWMDKRPSVVRCRTRCQYAATLATKINTHTDILITYSMWFYFQNQESFRGYFLLCACCIGPWSHLGAPSYTISINNQ